MDKYLLLRDNKQSGPFTVAEMIAKGIKAYDLVWLEGKSAAWRYPSEIEELKPYAPAVEEQPYDRFYKKKTTDQNGSAAVSEQVREDRFTAARQLQSGNALVSDQSGANPREMARPAAKTAEGIADKDHSAYQPRPQEALRQKVYINFPGSRTQVPASNAKEGSHEKEKITAASTAYTRSEPLPVNVNEKLSNEASPASWNQSVASWNVSSSDRNAPPATAREKGFFFRSYITWIIASCLVLAGVLIGLVISNIGQHKNMKDLDIIIKQIQEREKQKIKPATTHHTWTGNTDTEPVEATDQRQSTTGAIPPAPDLPKNGPPARRPALTASNPYPAQHIKAASTKDGARENQNSRRLDDRKAEEATINAVTEQKTGMVSNTPPPATGREHLYKLVTVKANKYKTGILGGISGLQLALTNGSQYTLDRVAVQVNYLGLEKKLVRSQNVYFKNIAPGEQVVQEVPKSGRGVYVEYMISAID